MFEVYLLHPHSTLENSGGLTSTQLKLFLPVAILVLYILSILPCIPTYSVQSTVLIILCSADNVCRGHAARGTLAGKAVCEWWSGRAVAPISGVYFHCFFFALPVPPITDCYRLLRSTTTTKCCIGLYSRGDSTG